MELSSLSSKLALAIFKKKSKIHFELKLTLTFPWFETAFKSLFDGLERCDRKLLLALPNSPVRLGDGDPKENPVPKRWLWVKLAWSGFDTHLEGSAKQSQ